MALNYVVTKRTFGFDESKATKFVAKSVTNGTITNDKLCRKVSVLCGIHRKIVDLVISGATDVMAEALDDGKTVRLGEFGLFRPTISAKAADAEEDVTASTITKRRIVFTPGSIFQDTLESMAVTRMATPDLDYTDGSSTSGSGNTGGGGNSGESGSEGNGDDVLDPLG